MLFGFGPLGLAPPGLAGPPGVAALLALAERADALGLDSFWLHQRHFSEPGSSPSPFVVGAAVAARTRRLRVGVCATITLAHPLRVAEDLAVLDVLSGGRTVFSPMRGYRSQDFAAFGVAARTKYGRFSAALRAIRASWDAEAHPARGGDDTADGVPPVRPRPVQATLPMWLGSFGTKGVELAADLGLPYFPAAVESLAGIRQKLALYAARRGHAPLPAERPIIRDVYVGASQQAALDEAGPGLRAQAALYRQWGVLADDVDPLVYARERSVVGDAVACHEQLARYREELGITYVVCRMSLPGLAPEQVTASLERFCTAVMPLLSG
ncbi:MAG: LLM class flavin-dependent oxidoreductase [Chloroflexi bacterium]|nr:LLM class flavin-dependent oxidoreductase [Chloroflexota bacterium]